MAAVTEQASKASWHCRWHPILDRLPSSVRNASYTFLLVFCYVAVGAAVLLPLEEKDCEVGTCAWSVVDVFYFCTVTMSTVGYGDLTPSLRSTKVFTLLWIVVGILFVFTTVASTVGCIIHPLNMRGRHLLEGLFPMEPVDLNGDGQIDYYKPRHWVIYYSKNLLPTYLINVISQLTFAAVFLCFEDWSYHDAVYHCIVTGTTVGYGDMSITSDGGKMWSILHIIWSVSLIGDMISTIDSLREERRHALAKVAQLSRKLDSELLKKCMDTAIALRPELVRDGLGITELEFVIGMLVELEVVELGQVKPFIKKFHALDMNGEGRLGQADVDMMARGEERATAVNMDISARSLKSKPAATAKVSPCPSPSNQNGPEFDGVVTR